MKRTILSIAFAAAINPVSANNITACGAILCLSTGIGGDIAECAEYLSAYFSIDYSDPVKTAEKRLSFLNSCDFISASGDDDDPAAQSLKRAIVHGAGHCDPQTLAQQLNVLEDFGSTDFRGNAIPVRIPQHCLDYVNHPLTADILLPTRIEEGDCNSSAITWSESYYNSGITCRARWVAPPPVTLDAMMQAARKRANATLRDRGLIP